MCWCLLLFLCDRDWVQGGCPEAGCVSAAAPEAPFDALLDTVMLQLRLAQVPNETHLLFSTRPQNS